MKSRLKLYAPLGIVLLAFGFVWLYLAHEHAFIFWDYVMYYDMAHALWAAPPQELMAVFASSFRNNYNLLYALPSLLTFSLFGSSRETFILTNYFFFFIGHMLAFAVLARQIFDYRWPKALLLGAAIPLCIPHLWFPLLEGYPDNGAAALFTLAVAYALGKTMDWKRALLIGLFLGFAVTFRRHYAYAALALVFVMGVFQFLSPLAQGWAETKKHPLHRGRARAPMHFLLLCGAVATSLLLTLLATEPHYLYSMLTVNYSELYDSYKRPPIYFLLFSLSHMGLFLIFSALAGFAYAIWTQPSLRRSLSLILFLSLLWGLVWSLGPGQAGQHYLISVLPIFCFTGLSAYFLRPRNNVVQTISVVVFTLLALNSAQALWFNNTPPLPSDEPSLSFFGTARPPWRRDDYNAILSLAKYVAEQTTDKDKIVLIGSSFIFNQDLMRVAFEKGLDDTLLFGRFIPVPDTDATGVAPLDALASASVFLVATPTQYHLDPEKQKVVTSLASFIHPSENFIKDPTAFSLSRNVWVHIWRRKEGWTPQSLHNALISPRNIHNDRRLWFLTKTNGMQRVDSYPDGSGTLLAYLSPYFPSATIFRDEKIKMGAYRLAMGVEFQPPPCAAPTVSIQLQTPDGKTLYEKSLETTQNNGPLFFLLPDDPRADEEYLSISVQSAASLTCAVMLHGLSLEKINN
jgi:hypothetical protein